MWFSLDHPSRPDRSSCWKSTSLLCSTDILVCWIPCISSSFFKVLGTTSTWSTVFTATTWVTLMPLGGSYWKSCQVFNYYCNLLAPVVTLLSVFTTLKLWGKWGPLSPSRDCIITCMLFPWSMVFVWLCMLLNEKVSISSFLVVLTTSLKLVGSTVWFAATLLWTESFAQWHANNWTILDPFKEAKKSSILLSLIMLMM